MRCEAVVDTTNIADARPRYLAETEVNGFLSYWLMACVEAVLGFGDGQAHDKREQGKLLL